MTSTENPQVGIIMGSDSDWPKIKGVAAALEEFNVAFEVNVMSAHRTPEVVSEYASGALGRGLKVIIAAAGGAAALPGAVAAWTDLPVIGVPIPSGELKGVDALYSIVQMPPGVPVGCVAVGSWGARNAAYLAAGILSLKHDNVREAYAAYRRRLREG